MNLETLSQFSFEKLLTGIQCQFNNKPMPEELKRVDFSSLILAVNQQYNGQIDEYNELVDTLLSRDETIESLELKVHSNLSQVNKAQQKIATLAEELKERDLLVESHKEQCENLAKQQREKDKQIQQLKKDLKAADAEVTKLRKAEKRAKAQISRLKESLAAAKAEIVPDAKRKIKELIETSKTMLRELSIYKQAAKATEMESYVAPLHNLYTDKDCHVLLVDKPQLVQVNNGKDHFYQYTLLFAHGCGTYYTYCLANKSSDEEEHKFVISSGVFHKADASDAEKENLIQYEVTIPKHVEAAMEKWLVKVNVEQDGKLLAEDYHMDLPSNIYPSAQAKARSKNIKRVA